MLLAGSDDRLRLWEHPNFGPSKTPDGALLALYDYGGEDIKVSVSGSFCVGWVDACGVPCPAPLYKPPTAHAPIHTYQRQIERLPLTGFPKDVAFHPHGLYFHKYAWSELA